MKPNAPYRVHEVDIASHLGPICELWQRNLAGLGGEAAQLKAQAGYITNPAGPGSAFLLQEEATQTHLGVICLHWRRFFRGERAMVGANLADFAVDSHLRTVGPALMLMRRALQVSAEKTELLYALPNTKSLPICKRAGLKALGHKTMYVGVLSASHPRLNALHHSLRPLVKTAGRMALALAHRWDRGPRGWHCVAADFHSPHVDALWQQRDPSLLFSERSTTMLGWRFLREGISTPWQLTLVQDQHGKPQGYVVWAFMNGLFEVGDFFLPDPSHQTRSLLRTFMSWARDQGGHSIRLEFMGPPQIHAQLAQAGLRKRGDTGVLMNTGLTEHPEFVTLFDSDD